MMKTTTLRTTFWLLCLLGMVRPLPAQALDGKVGCPEGYEQRIDSLFSYWDTSRPGASVAVLLGDKVVFKNGYGLANLEHRVPNTPETVFNIGSNSKQFTALLVLLLEQEGKLSLDDDIRKYLPELYDFGEKIRISDLLHHTHGIREGIYLLGMAGWRLEDVVAREDMFRFLTQQKALNFSPGTQWQYNNSGYMLLAEIIERVSGRSFSRCLQERIFHPLGMDHTQLPFDFEQVIGNVADSYSPDSRNYKKSIRNTRGIVGSTGIHTSLEDLSKWVAHLNDPRPDKKQLIDKFNQRGTLKSGDTISYALGQFVYSYKGEITIGHGGSDAGYRSHMVRFPEKQLSILVLANDASLNAEEKALGIADIFLEKGSSEIQRTEDGPGEHKVVEVPVETLRAYEGSYELRPDFILEFNERDGVLYVTATGQGTLRLKTKDKNEFELERIGAVITFNRDDGGNVRSLNFTRDGNITQAKRLSYNLDNVQLREYLGIYHSDELDSAFELVVRDSKLTALHPRQDDTMLTALAEDRFTGDTWYLGILDFVRDENQIEGFRVSNDRVQNLWFQKIENIENK